MNYNQEIENKKTFDKLSEVVASCKTSNQIYTAYRMAVRYAEIKDFYKVDYLVKDAVKDLRNKCIGNKFTPFTSHTSKDIVTVTESNFSFVVVKTHTGHYKEIKTEVFFNNYKEV